MDVRGWTDKKKDSHAASIDVLTAKVAADVSKLERNALKRSKTGAGAGAVAGTPVQALPHSIAEILALTESKRFPARPHPPARMCTSLERMRPLGWCASVCHTW